MNKKLLLLLLFPACFLFHPIAVYAQDANAANTAAEIFDLQVLGTRFLIDVIAIFVLVRLIYYTRHRNKDFQFTLILFNCVNFMICFLLSGSTLKVGFAFGLFAIFSIMRYRTETVPVKEMGYLFISVAMGLINSLASIQDSYIILLAANSFIILLPLLLDNTKKVNINNPKSNAHTRVDIKDQDIIYERIDLIKPEKRNEMMEDIRIRTGLPVYKVDIVNINFMNDTAMIKVHYK